MHLGGSAFSIILIRAGNALPELLASAQSEWVLGNGYDLYALSIAQELDLVAWSDSQDVADDLGDTHLSGLRYGAYGCGPGSSSSRTIKYSSLVR